MPTNDQPYLYVAPWGTTEGDGRGHSDDATDDYWDDEAFGGASLGYRELLDADDQYGTALAFLRRGHSLLTG